MRPADCRVSLRFTMAALIHRRLRAPLEDGAVLINPRPSEITALIKRNQAIGAQFDRLGEFPAEYRKSSRLQAALAARVIPNDHKLWLDAPFILSGHQPDLFHPGVWLKNFLLSSIANS